MKKLPELCKDIISKRCVEICDSISQENWYLNIQEKIIEKRTNIYAYLNDDAKNEFNDYDDLKLEISNKIIDEIYMQAFKDGMSMRELLTPILTPNSSL
ncbi:hypothetical protein V6C42_13085 [Pseudoclostridium thermosuccinogenes]|uniref:hypothetical protein n=1 Tax=Clostridium thermosuccinogenes TaxID=84032 RepID=UPI002FDAF45E